jgi:hypothetical protein
MLRRTRLPGMRHRRLYRLREAGPVPDIIRLIRQTLSNYLAQKLPDALGLFTWIYCRLTCPLNSRALGAARP